MSYESPQEAPTAQINNIAKPTTDSKDCPLDYDSSTPDEWENAIKNCPGASACILLGGETVRIAFCKSVLGDEDDILI